MIEPHYRLGLTASISTQNSAQATLHELLTGYDNGEIAQDQPLAINNKQQLISYGGRKLRLMNPQERKRINQLLSTAGWKTLNPMRWTMPTITTLRRLQPPVMIGQKTQTQLAVGELLIANELQHALRKADQAPLQDHREALLTPDAHIGLNNKGEFMLYKAHSTVNKADIRRIKQLLKALLPAEKLPAAMQLSTPMLLQTYLGKVARQEAPATAESITPAAADREEQAAPGYSTVQKSPKNPRTPPEQPVYAAIRKPRIPATPALERSKPEALPGNKRPDASVKSPPPPVPRRPDRLNASPVPPPRNAAHAGNGSRVHGQQPVSLVRTLIDQIEQKNPAIQKPVFVGKPT